MIIDKYLKWLSEMDDVEESIFPIDSISSGKPLRVVYPESTDIESNFDMSEKRIMIDFDGVIHKYSSGWGDGSIYDDPIDGSKEAIEQFRNDGYKVIIFTARLSEIAHGKSGVSEQKKMIEDWLKKYKIEVDGMMAEKLPASIYIDDNAFWFNGKWDKENISVIMRRL
jgi:hypothetical protein